MTNGSLGGLVLDGNIFSSYCLLAPLSDRKKVRDLRDIFAFILFYSDKHIQAGLPIGSVLGDTVRRLIISLLRFPKVKNIIFLKGGELKDSVEILKRMKTIFEEGRIDEDLIRRGRIDQYDPRVSKFTENIKSFKFHEVENFNALRNVCGDIKNEIFKDFELPQRHEVSYFPIRFKPLNSTIEAYSKPSEEDLLTIKVFNKVTEAYDYYVNVVKTFGLLYPDGNGVYRYQVKMPYITIALEKWDDLENLLIKTGIHGEIKKEEKEENEKRYNKDDFILIGNFTERLMSENLNNLKEFIDFLKNAVEFGRLNFSRDLDFVSVKEGSSGLIQVGWSKIKVSAYKNNGETIIFDFYHILRSIDVHNGLPYNLYLLLY